MSAAAAELFQPPVPAAPTGQLPWWRLFAAFRDNAITAWPARAYEEPVLRRRLLGRTSLLLNDPAAIREVLVDGAERFERSPASQRLLRPILGDGLLISKGEAWRHQRRTLAPAFAPKAVQLLVPHIRSAAREAIDGLAAQEGTPVDLFAALQLLTLEIAGRSMFSLEMRRHGPALRRFVSGYGRGLGRPRMLDFLLPIAIPSPHDLARRRFHRRWMAFIAEVIAERLAAPAEGAPRDLFDALLRARDPETGAAFSRDRLGDQVATLLVAGHETTAVALFWAIYLLAMAPRIQDEVAAELAASPTDLEAAPLPLTRAVIDEALRLFPPAFAIVRATREATTVAGIAVDRGTLLIVAPWLLHRHRRLWRDPEAFDPTRFLPEAPAIDRFAYLPFGIGPRICIGAHFALTEARLVLADLLRAFRIECLERRPVVPVAVVTTQPDRSPFFRLVRR